jgi:hypothetical protein
MQYEKPERSQQQTTENSTNPACGMLAKHQGQATAESSPVSFCHRCGYPHNQPFCPRCGHRQCIACGDG